MTLLLLAGTPGQAKSEVVKKIAAFLANAGCKPKVGFASVESLLLRSLRSNAVGSTFSSNEQLARVIATAPQDKVRALWPAAFDAACEEASQNGADIAIICCCLQFYRSETYEFYSPIDLPTIQRRCPKSVLTLIDDIYDVYYRLSQRGEVFDILAHQARAFSKGKPVGTGVSNARQLYKDAINLVIQALLRILVWREKEIESAAAISRIAKCGHNVLAAKHPIETGAKLLLGETTTQFQLSEGFPVYISHPISRPRRVRNSTGNWPDFVRNLNGVVTALAGGGERYVLPVIPTAIDEFRLLSDGDSLVPHLTPRWPLLEGDLLWTSPGSDSGGGHSTYEQYERELVSWLFDPPVDDQGWRIGCPLMDAEISGMLRTLTETIRLQMAGRDHLLVRQCPGFYLFRPVYQEGVFSSGVTNELHTFDQIRKWEQNQGSQRRLCFTYSKEDYLKYFGPSGNKVLDGIRAKVYTTVTQVVADHSDKTKAPNHPLNSIPEVLKNCGNLQSDAKRVYEEMFPTPGAGSIGEELPLTWFDVMRQLSGCLEERRASALGNGLPGSYKYTHSAGNTVRHERRSDSANDVYVDVVDDLETRVEMSAAANRARDFFSKARDEFSQQDAAT